jgi:hypothetical protein
VNRADRFYLSITALLLVAAIAGGVMLAVQHSRNRACGNRLISNKSLHSKVESFISVVLWLTPASIPGKRVTPYRLFF